MAYETIEFKLEGGIARLTLNRPDRLNSFTVKMHEEVADALSSLEGARVLVLTGAGRGFCAGRTSATARWRRARRSTSAIRWRAITIR
jgi:2-(1,2-epoxy-1,2-dihydrophenyl)acetyl-CoA isomerase